MPAFTAPLLLAFMLAPTAKEPLDLKWKFAEGDTLYLTCTEESDSSATDNGKTADTASMTTVDNYKLVVGATSEKETAFELTLGIARTGYAAARKDIKLETRKRQEGESFSFVLRPEYKVAKIRGNDSLWTKVPNLRPEGTAKGLVANLFSTIPGKRLVVGESWVTETEHPMDGGYMELIARSRVEGVTNGVVKLVASTDHAWDNRGARTTVSFDELKGENGTRTTWFDLKTGRVQKVEEEYTTTGTLRAPWSSTVVTHHMRHVIEVSDKPPKDE